jgi:hypothetical protein
MLNGSGLTIHTALFLAPSISLRSLARIPGPATPCLQSRTLKNTKCFVRCRLHVKPSRFSLSQLYRSCTEFVPGGGRCNSSAESLEYSFLCDPNLKQLSHGQAPFVLEDYCQQM